MKKNIASLIVSINNLVIPVEIKNKNRSVLTYTNNNFNPTKIRDLSQLLLSA